MKSLRLLISLIIITLTCMSINPMVTSTIQILPLSLLAQTVNLEEIPEDPEINTNNENEAIDLDDDDELLPAPEYLIGQYPHDFFLTPGFSSRSFSTPGSSDHSYAEQELSRGDSFGGNTNLAHQAADRAQAAEQAQHGAAAKAALVAAFRLAEEAKTAAKEAEAVAAAKQYHAAHLSSAAQGAQGRAFAEAAFSAKVSKVLHAAEGQQKQSKQQAELLKSAAYAAQSLSEQSSYVTEALRHLFSAQKAAALESRDNAKKLSLQQQEALERLSQAQAAANKAHAAAAAALANVHKNGIYGGGDTSLFGTTSEEEYEAKISYHTEHQGSYQDGATQGQNFQSEPVTYHSGPTGPQYEERPTNKVAYPSPHYEQVPDSSQVDYQPGQDQTFYQHDHTESSPLNFQQNTRNFQTSPLEDGTRFPPSHPAKGSVSGQIEINDGATERFFDQGNIYPTHEKDQNRKYGVTYLEEGEVIFDHGDENVGDWSRAQTGQSSPYGRQISDDSTYAFSDPNEGGEFYEKDGKVVYSRQVDLGENKMKIFDGQNRISAIKEGLEGVSMSRMQKTPFIVNGDGSDLVFRKKNAPTLKYSPVPEGPDMLAMLGRSGEVSLPKESDSQERDSGSEAQETTSESAEGRAKERESSTRVARGGRVGGGRRKLRVFKEKTKPSAAIKNKTEKVSPKSGEEKKAIVKTVGVVLEPAVNT